MTVGNDNDESPPPDTYQAQSATKIWLLLISLMITMFLVALDRTIISTAIPRITNEFHSLDDVGWYGSSYLLTCCAFQLLYGKIYTLYAVKAVFLASIFLFELGSAVCGAAPTSTAFIIGRAISGVGAAGIFAGSVVCIVYAVPLEKRPKIQGLYGALFGLASIVGPLIGGAFTSKIIWGRCFYINLPFGAVAMLAIFFCLKIPDRPTTRVPRTEKLSQLDISGTLCLVPGIVCLVLALQWGGQSYAWNNGRIVALFTVMGILLLAFVGIQVFWTRTATIPPRIFKQRSIISGFWATLCVGSSQYIIVYFLPIWFQSIKGVSAVNSGIQLLPTMLSLVVGSLASGLTTPKIGYYTPFAISGSCIMSIGAGLLTMLQVHTVEAKCIGYQILYGFGMGLCFQQPNLAAQAVLPALDVPIGLAIIFFSQLLGAAVLVPVGENVLANQLLKRLSGIDGIDPSLITSTGATSLLDSVPAGLRDTVLDAYNESLRKVFQVGLILSCLSILGNATLEWVSVLKDKQASAAAASPGTSEHDKIEIDEEKIVGGGAK
ncbi:major facilitator superfamily domain-containing protein [Aspergillus alliaceus]|uniref:Major facilitator superfamily domain-containing protein n=1 Tax=Petromyces alliaceus TaxID=209559 RepID=A0A5N7BU77_PETAA|nr:major facilitator superfamily domain-containing protein [Aspergillus alliaceus]